MKPNKWIGRRVIKTGLSVFITAMICKWLELPVIFAVITAIVTTEPTAADSMKKGLIRLPAAAIGASFAIILDHFIGHSALTYALVTMLTIITCAKFKLDNGTLVATLTAVAMIPGTSEGFFADFIFRLTGTTIGIMVSTLVNYVVLPPKFGPILARQIDSLYHETASCFQRLFYTYDHDDLEPTKMIRPLYQQLDKVHQISEYQNDEWKYRVSGENEVRSFQFLQKKLDFLQQILFRFANVTYYQTTVVDFNKKEQQLIRQVISSLTKILKDPLHRIPSNHYSLVKQIREIASEKEQDTLFFLLSTDLIIIHETMEKLAEMTKVECSLSMKDESYPKYIFDDRMQYE